MFIKPARAGLKVRDPITKLHLPADGAEVASSSYWLRRLRSSEVVECAPPAPVAAPAAVPAPVAAEPVASDA